MKYMLALLLLACAPPASQEEEDAIACHHECAPRPVSRVHRALGSFTCECGDGPAWVDAGRRNCAYACPHGISSVTVTAFSTDCVCAPGDQ